MRWKKLIIFIKNWNHYSGKKITHVGMIFIILIFVELVTENALEVRKHLGNEKQNEMIKQGWLFQEPNDLKTKKYTILNHYQK